MGQSASFIPRTFTLDAVCTGVKHYKWWWFDKQVMRTDLAGCSVSVSWPTFVDASIVGCV